MQLSQPSQIWSCWYRNVLPPSELFDHHRNGRDTLYLHFIFAVEYKFAIRDFKVHSNGKEHPSDLSTRNLCTLVPAISTYVLLFKWVKTFKMHRNEKNTLHFRCSCTGEHKRTVGDHKRQANLPESTKYLPESTNLMQILW